MTLTPTMARSRKRAFANRRQHAERYAEGGRDDEAVEAEEERRAEPLADRVADVLAGAQRAPEVELDGVTDPDRVLRQEGTVEVVLLADRLQGLRRRGPATEERLLGAPRRDERQGEHPERDDQQQDRKHGQTPCHEDQ